VEALLSATLGGLRGRRVLELYAGAGALSLRLAQRGAQVSSVDSFRPNLARLEQAARAQGLTLSTRAVSAEIALTAVERPDAVIVDPPRRGLSQAVRRALGELAPRAVVYISCEPRTLARDLSHLRQLGLSAESTTPWDMIPLSDAVETITLLKPSAPPPLRILYQSPKLLAVERPASTITPEGDKFAPLLERIRQLPGYAEAVLPSELDPVGSGICLAASQPRVLAELRAALQSGSQHYLCLVRGIARQKGRIERPTRAGRSSTRYRRERVVGTHSLLCVQPEPGQRSELRRHLASIGHPVLGDARYGDAPSNRYFDEKHGLDRAFVHCSRVELQLEGAPITIESELAPDLAAVLESLETPPSVELEETTPSGE
jgi:23S rRNA (uracil1939-C5)-methyltransferase